MRLKNYVAVLIALAVVIVGLTAHGIVYTAHASGAGESPTTPVGTPTSNETTVTETVTTTVSTTITKTMTYYSVITHTQEVPAAVIEYYGPMTYFLLFLIMALTVALGFALKKCRSSSSTSST